MARRGRSTEGERQKHGLAFIAGAVADPEKERTGLVFGTSKGTPMSASNYSRRIFKPLMKSLGLEFKTHDLRKMYGSFLIAQGENIVTVSRWMGHSTPSVTLDIYAKVVTDRQSAHELPRMGMLNP